MSCRCSHKPIQIYPNMVFQEDTLDRPFRSFSLDQRTAPLNRL
jgi:hypothetical protein